MNNKKHRKKSRTFIAVITLIALLLPTFSSYAAAGGGNTAEPNTIISYAISFKATSDDTGLADVYATSSGKATFITSKVTLQSAPLGSASFTTVSGLSPSIYTVYDSAYIKHLCSFPITTTKNYRIKIEITDEVNGKQATYTTYKTLTR